MQIICFSLFDKIQFKETKEEWRNSAWDYAWKTVIVCWFSIYSNSQSETSGVKIINNKKDGIQSS